MFFLQNPPWGDSAQVPARQKLGRRCPFQHFPSAPHQPAREEAGTLLTRKHCMQASHMQLFMF